MSIFKSYSTNITTREKTNLKMAVDCSDETIADLMTDGGNMGVKSFSRYLNRHKATDKTSKELTKN